MEKRLKNINKKEILFLLSFLIIIGFLVFVFATTTTNSPVANGNYSTTLNFSCTTDLINATNASLLYNASGGAATTYLVTVVNTSVGQTVFENASVGISGLSDALRLYNMTCLATNLTNSNEYSTAVSNITIDSTPPNVSSYHGIVDGSYHNSVGLMVLNVSVSDGGMGVESVYFNITNSSGDQINWTKASNPSGVYYNISVNTSGFAEAKYNVTVYANDTQLNNLNNTERIQIEIDRTAPVVSGLTMSSYTGTSLTITFSGAEGTCTADRSGASISGGTLTETGLNCGNSYTYTITCTDSAGNSGSSSATSFSTSSCGGGSTSTTPSLPKKVNSWTKITPGAATIMKNFDPEIGVKEIEITVNNEAQNVKITVNKYDSKPAEVTKEKTGKVNKYLKIETENLKDKLNKATITIQVEKTWVSDNALEKNNIALFKFDETSENWNELSTILTEEDDTYYYYDVELTSFSYFVIGEKVLEEPAGVGSVGEVPEGEKEIFKPEEKKNVWMWVGIVAAILIIVMIVMYLKKKR